MKEACMVGVLHIFRVYLPVGPRRLTGCSQKHNGLTEYAVDVRNHLWTDVRHEVFYVLAKCCENEASVNLSSKLTQARIAWTETFRHPAHLDRKSTRLNSSH